MINIKLEGKMSIEQALKKYKMKFSKHKVIEELRERTHYVKDSVKRRDELKRAEYRETKRREENGE
jgi:small subunit ribosomal protein S21